MNEHGFLDPDVLQKLATVRQQCEHKRKLEAWFQACLRWLLLVIGGTLLLYLSQPTPLWRNLIVLLSLGVAAFVFRRFVWPVYAQPITLEQVALFIDEHYPELENRIVSMVSLSDQHKGQPNSWMVRRFLTESQTFVRNSPLSYDMRLQFTHKQGWLVMGMLLLTGFLMLRFNQLWMPSMDFDWKRIDTEFTVEPGNATVRMGADQTIFLRSHVGARAVTLEWRTDGSDWQALAMQLGESEGVYFQTLTNVTERITYRIRFGARMSQTFVLTPWIPPEVEYVDLTYQYPDYMNIPPKEVPNGGDITAIEGTRVTLSAQVNKPLERLEMVLEDSETRIAFTRKSDLLWEGDLVVQGKDRYHLEPLDKDKTTAPYMPTFNISAQPDKPPRIKVDFPFRDMEVSPLDEIGFSFKVSDDYSLADFGIRYQVTDKDPIDISLKEGDEDVVSAEGYHQLMLEDLKLEPGDVLTWAVWARDRKPNRDPYDAFGDPFFLEIRPFKRLFRESISNSGQQQQGGGDDLVTKQKEILIATWNLRRDSKDLAQDEYDKKRQTIHKTQGAILEQAENTLGQTAGDRPEFKQLLEAMNQSLSALDDARGEEVIQELTEAAGHQQRAYRLLLKLEPPQTQVSRNRANSENTGGPRRQMAGMDDLEMKRNRNFYEEERVTRRQQEAAAETLDEIKDLAQRQKLINNEIARLISEMEQKEADAEEIQRRLERLQEEARKNMEELDRIQQQISNSEMDSQVSSNSRRELDKVRERMNRTLENLQPENLQQARAAGREAEQNLEHLEENLEERTRGNARERVDDLQQQITEMRQKQQQIQQKIDELGDEKDSPHLTANDPKQTAKNELLQQKRELAEQYREAMEDAAEVATMTRNDQEHLARKLGDWLRKTSREGIGEDMEETEKLARFGVWDELARKEQGIAEKLEKAEQRLSEVAQQMAGNELEAARQALDQLRQIQGQAQGMGDSPEEMERLAGEQYRDWLQKLRDAEDLLGDENRHAQPLRQIRRQIENLRRSYKRDNLIPKFEMVKDGILEPLTDTVHNLEREVKALANERRFILTDDGSVPERYRKDVAEYFRVLSETEGN